MKNFKYAVSLMMVLALALVFIGCAKPPEAEQKAAKAAMDAAVTAGADKYAVADLDAAKKEFDTAEAQVKDKKYKEAKEGYVKAEAAFKKAAGAVAAGKKAIADEATAAVAALETAWKDVEAAAKKVEKKMKDKKDAWAADAKAFGENLKAAKDAIAAEPTVAKTKVGELKGVIEKWEAALKELAAPAKPEDKKKK
jgi:PBP1b-binding outer membrane lipoprotein LpoB